MQTEVPEVHPGVEKLARLREGLSRVIRGKEEVIDLLAIALLSNGSVLMEDVPGVGKTTLAKALALSVELSFRRVQFTPDLMPADILGTSIYNPQDGSFDFRAGPIFCNVLLADEINRASPRTQSALLEAMSETQATIEGQSRPLPRPFFVLATQNPVDFHGTYPLPEAQLDRFLIYLQLGYPDEDTEVSILFDQSNSHPIDHIRPVLSADELIDMQEHIRTIPVEESVAQYMVQIVRRTRDDDRLQLGVSPRGSLMLFRASQARAFMLGREYVTPDDVQAMVCPILSHRVILTSKSRYSHTTKLEILNEAVESVPVPT
ncbi:AAA family ATPase [Calycomorphotria hydatis]|uniref:AAA family ATPase n=1 Tax=Calycomorphotria hydatis TaxID=2528027 RepID=UPI001E58BB29|nr:MoxR family ATPase [Calycomorphotria hydatis]